LIKNFSLSPLSLPALAHMSGQAHLSAPAFCRTRPAAQSARPVASPLAHLRCLLSCAPLGDCVTSPPSCPIPMSSARVRRWDDAQSIDQATVIPPICEI
jgi:hypothetical protein